MKGKKGGARPNAGRKKGGHNRIPPDAQEAKNQLNELVKNQWTPIIETLIRTGLGDYYEEKQITGDLVKVYKASPDVKALTTLIEFVVGKPKQEVENSGSMKLESQAINDLTTTLRTILNKKP